MQTFFAIISFSPFVLILLVVLLILNMVVKNKMSKKLSVYTISLTLFITVVLIWYHFPNNNILKDISKDSAYVSTQNVSIEVKDKVQLEQLFETINSYTYVKSAVKSMAMEPFPGKNLIRIDIDDVRKGKPEIIHIYILSNFDEKGSQTLDSLAEGNILQINEQFYSVMDSEGLSIDIYELLKEFGVISSKSE